MASAGAEFEESATWFRRCKGGEQCTHFALRDHDERHPFGVGDDGIDGARLPMKFAVVHDSLGIIARKVAVLSSKS